MVRKVRHYYWNIQSKNIPILNTFQKKNNIRINFRILPTLSNNKS
jgi:hypothetical protein